MEDQAQLILIRNKDTNQFEDATDSINRFDWLENNTKIEIQYIAGNRCYTYAASRVKVLALKGTIGVTDEIILEEGVPIDAVETILDYDSHIKIVTCSGDSKVIEKKLLRLEKSMSETEETKRVKVYFEQLFVMLTKLQTAKPNSETIENEENPKMSFLEFQFNKVLRISESSVLGHYLGRKPPVTYSDEEPLIFPFSFNLSQKEAVTNALTHQVSIVQGPPGTGKTQTILNLLANLLLRGKHVAVVSNNNSPVENVIEKLEKYGYGYLIAQLGSGENQERFFEREMHTLPDFETYVISEEERLKLEAELVNLMSQLENLLKVQNQLACSKEMLIKYQTERTHYESVNNETHVYPSEISIRKKWSKDKLFQLVQELESVTGIDYKLTILQKVQYFLDFGIYNFNKIEGDALELIKSSYQLFYNQSIELLSSEIAGCELTLQSGNMSQLMERYTEVSESLFKNALGKMDLSLYNQSYTKKEYLKQYRTFKKRYPIATSTTHSLLSSCPKQYKFDWVITDESSQVDLMTAYLTMSAANNMVVVGDPQQLNQIPEKLLVPKSDVLSFDMGLSEVYNYATKNMITSIMGVFGESVPMTRLTEHYRCHPQVIRYCNEKYYDNTLVIMTEGHYDDKVLKLVKTAPGNHARNLGNTWFNTRQAEIIRDEVLGCINDGAYNPETIGIIAPYRCQVEEIEKHIKAPKIAVDSVHKFQGREKDTIIFSTTVNELNNFVDQPELVNVAVSRAVKELVVLCPSNGFKQHGSHIGDLIRHMEYNAICSEVVISAKTSVFDLLYNEYSEHLLSYQKKVKEVSDVASENVLYAVIEELLEEERFNSFKCVLHTPLHGIVGDFSLLTDEETRFAKHPNAHVDFLIYNRHDKEPVLAVEVDGFAFHKNSPEQLVRDEKKNSILEKIGLPLIRLATYESGERERLCVGLEKVISGGSYPATIKGEK